MPTPTPPYGDLITLSSGRLLLIERVWTAGDLFLALALAALGALLALHWLYSLAHRERKTK